MASGDGHFDTLEDPVLVVEVLSPTTERYDRGAKFEHYRLLESLNTYVLVAQDTVLVEVYSREPEGRWLYEAFNDVRQDVALPSLNLRIPMASLYENVPVKAGPRPIPAEVAAERPDAEL